MLGGVEVRHRTNRYLHNPLEQDHRGIKQQIQSMGASSVSSQHNGFAKSMTKYGTFCARARRNEVISLGDGSCTPPVHGFS